MEGTVLNHKDTPQAAYRRHYYALTVAAVGEKKAMNAISIRTMAETANILGVSPQYIHQIEQRALKKIRIRIAPWKEDMIEALRHMSL
jgi:hypothetical protein